MYKIGLFVVWGSEVVLGGDTAFKVDVNSKEMLTVRKSGGTLDGEAAFDGVRTFSD